MIAFFREALNLDLDGVLRLCPCIEIFVFQHDIAELLRLAHGLLHRFDVWARLKKVCNDLLSSWFLNFSFNFSDPSLVLHDDVLLCRRINNDPILVPHKEIFGDGPILQQF